VDLDVFTGLSGCVVVDVVFDGALDLSATFVDD
jgi:hypothetical protein